MCAAVAGCGGGDAGFSSTNVQFGTKPPSAAEARKLVDPFLYELDAACPSTWLTSKQGQCRSTARKLKSFLARPRIGLPKRGKLPYQFGGVDAGAATYSVGNRQPYPGSGPLFFATVTLRRSSGKWLIASFGS